MYNLAISMTTQYIYLNFWYSLLFIVSHFTEQIFGLRIIDRMFLR